MRAPLTPRAFSRAGRRRYCVGTMPAFTTPSSFCTRLLALAALACSACDPDASEVDALELDESPDPLALDESADALTLDSDREFHLVLGGDASHELVAYELAPRRSMGTEDPDILAKLAELGQGSTAPLGTSAAQRRAEVTQRTLDEAATLEPDAPVRVLLMLDDPEFDFGRLAQADDAQRRALIGEREASLAASQDALARQAATLGATELARYWLGGNDLLVELPAGEVRAAAGLPGVVGVQLDERGGVPTAAYTVGDAVAGMGAESFVDFGYDGNANSKNGAGSPVRIGLFEHDGDCAGNNYPTPSHPAFADWSGGPSRVKSVMSCGGGTCSATTKTGAAHGQVVAGAALQSARNGEDPSVTTTADRMDRTGASPESELYYYNIACWYTGIRGALQQAVVHGVDIGNMSFRFPTCDASFDHSNVNQTIYDATWSGMLLLAATGNDSNSLSDACEIGWPSYRPEILAVAGLDTSDENTAYASANVGIGVSSQGGMPITARSGAAGTAAGVDLTAPGVMRLLVDASSYKSSSVGGSSVATPLVVGAAANLRDAFYSLGYGDHTANAFRFLTNVLLMGDGSNGWNVGSASYGFDRTKPNRRSGYGRTQMWFPSSNALLGPWGWGTHTFAIHQGETVAFTVGDAGPESYAVDEWTWAVTWYVSDLNSVDDIDISVWNTCPAGGGAAQQIASQTDFDYRNRIRLAANEIGGRCLEMRVYGYSVRPEGMWVDMADMFHAE